MSIARVSFARRFYASGIEGKLINTVHDSIVVDVADTDVARVNTLFKEVFRDLPTNINKIFNIGFDLDVGVEVLVGHNQGDLYEIEN